MHLLDIVIGKVEQAQLHHIAECPCSRELFQVVITQVENLQGLTYLAGCHMLPVVTQLICLDTLVTCQIERLDIRQVVVHIRQAGQLRTVIKLQVGESSHLVPCLLGIFLGKAMVL